MKQDKKYHLFVYSFLFSIFFIGLFSWHEAHAVVFENPITAVTLQELIAVIVRGILGFLGTLCAVLIAYCGFRYMTAKGDANQTKGALECIVNAVLGLIIAMAAYLVADYIISAVSSLA